MIGHCAIVSVSHKDQLKRSLGPSIEILKGPFQILRVPMMQERFCLKQRPLLLASFFVCLFVCL